MHECLTTVKHIMYYQGRIEPPEVARGHVGSVDRNTPLDPEGHWFLAHAKPFHGAIFTVHAS